MQAPFEWTEGRKKLAEIIGAFPPGSPHWNEAQNRFQFIDRLLLECLGWQRPYIEVEKFDDLGGRADYLLGQPVKAALEAKREAKLFKLPPVGKPTIVRKMRPLIEGCKVFEEVVTQVIPYCAIHGAQIGVVCNGPQLAIFQALVFAESPLDGECFLFDGFQSYLDEFAQLWNLLSPEGISENRAYRDLAIFRNPRVPPKASVGIAEPMRYRYRSGFQENLRDLSELLLEEIELEPEVKPLFYKECYVPLAANNRHLLLSKRMIAARYSRAAGGGDATKGLDTIAEINDGGELKIDATVSSTSSRPVVVIGDVGVGKTSFFENLFEQLDATEKANTYFIHINLGIKANLSKDVKSYVLDEVPAVLKSKYGLNIQSREFAEAIYHEESREFDKSTKAWFENIGDVELKEKRREFLLGKVANAGAHLHAVFAHLSRGRNKQIILVLDNADQRGIEVQQEAFLIAQELAATRNLIVFVALRPSTFYTSKTSGALSGYQNRVLTIAPPPADEVIQKRIAFAVRVAEGKAAPATLAGIRLQLKSVVSFLNAMLRSIRANQAIRQFLSNITGGNTRAVIELVTSFCGSPNVDSEKIVTIEEEQGNYVVPLHEFTKHALLGDYAYYNPLSSLVGCNIFDVSAPDPREHFLAALIIGFLNSGSAVRDSDGFVTGAALITEMMRHGFVEDQIRASIRKLASKKLIETPYGHYREIKVPGNELPDQFHFRVTSVGIYHLQYWSGSFSFLDAVSTDTPIFDSVIRDRIIKLAPSFDIRDRFNKTNEFRTYLESQWQAANINAGYLDMIGVMQLQSASFRSVKDVIDRAAKRGRG